MPDERDNRDKLVSVRLNGEELDRLTQAARIADRKASDMARVLILRGLDDPRTMGEGGI